jgi:hypothetical protein
MVFQILCSVLQLHLKQFISFLAVGLGPVLRSLLPHCALALQAFRPFLLLFGWPASIVFVFKGVGVGGGAFLIEL